MDLTLQQARAHTLRALHDGPTPLLLLNAWDVISARLFAQAGARAIGTSSAGIAAVLGYPDGERIARDQMLAMVERIAHAVELPVSADMESGYGSTPEEAAQMARAVIAAGAVGLNLEDGSRDATLVDLSVQVQKIQAIKEVAREMQLPLLLNARTDTYWLALGDPETRFELTVQRLRAYREAGADALFVPGLTDEQQIAELVRVCDAPLNILVGPATPPIAVLAQLGVKRISIGSGALRAALGLVRHIADDLLQHGSYTSLTSGAIPYAEVNQLLE